MKKIIVFISILSTLFLSCQDQKETGDLRNTEAAIPAKFNFDQMGLRVLASFVSKSRGTMSTLYGNRTIGTDTVRVLVTWKQQADPRWFGARIPAALQSIEVVKQAAPVDAYEIYQGRSLTPANGKVNSMSRINYILSLKPSVMP